MIHRDTPTHSAANPPEFGLLVGGDQEITRLRKVARTAEALGFDRLWIADEKFYRDPFVSLAVSAEETSRIGLGCCATEPYSRHPALIAMAVATLFELCGTRLILAIGAGGTGFGEMHITRHRPAQAIREAVALIRELLTGSRVDFGGEVVRFSHGQLSTKPASVPIYVAARGYHTLAVAGAIADGVVVAPFATASALSYALSRVSSGSQSAARKRVPPILAKVDVAIVDHDEAVGRLARRAAALPLWVSYPDWRFARELGLDIPKPVFQLAARRDYRDLSAIGELLPDIVVRTFTVAGSTEDVSQRLGELCSVVDGVIVNPLLEPDSEITPAIERMAQIANNVRSRVGLI